MTPSRLGFASTTFKDGGEGVLWVIPQIKQGSSLRAWQQTEQAAGRCQPTSARYSCSPPLRCVPHALATCVPCRAQTDTQNRARLVQLLSSAAAFMPASSLMPASARGGRRLAACGLRMQEVEAQQEAEEDAPQLSRAARRMQAKMAKKNTDGTSKATQQATGGVRVGKGKKNAGPPPDLVELAFEDEVPAGDGGRKAFDIPGSQQPLMLMRYKNKIIGSAAQCTKCKFPLVGADYADSVLKCKVCGTGYKLPNGDLVESQGTLLSGLFSKTQATPLPVFATLIKDGKVLMGVKPKE